MKTKQEQIDEMAKVIQKIYITKISRNEYCLAQDIREAGYRKASDVIDEFVERVLAKIKYEYENYPNAMTVGTYHQLRKEINDIATEMRQEVEK